MKIGCKEFQSFTMDKTLKIKPTFDRRIDDVNLLAGIKLEHIIKQSGKNNEARCLIEELTQYIYYLYDHIERAENEKQILNKKYLQQKCKNKSDIH